MARPAGRGALRDAIRYPAIAASATLRQAAALSAAAHRPWPPPSGPWFMGQTWRHLLFAHWPIEPGALAERLPPPLAPDVRDGVAWIAVTPFRVEGLRLRLTPPLPLVSRFVEVNVRTYVTIEGKAGIYFLSLDASSALAVAAARRAYRLPYFEAEVSLRDEGGRFECRSARRSADGPPAELECAYRPSGPTFAAERGSLEHFLTERYCLYTLDERGSVLRGEIHHRPWPLQRAEGEIAENTMASGYGLELTGDPLLHYAARQDVVLWRVGPPAGAGRAAAQSSFPVR